MDCKTNKDGFHLLCISYSEHLAKVMIMPLQYFKESIALSCMTYTHCYAKMSNLLC